MKSLKCSSPRRPLAWSNSLCTHCRLLQIKYYFIFSKIDKFFGFSWFLMPPDALLQIIVVVTVLMIVMNIFRITFPWPSSLSHDHVLVPRIYSDAIIFGAVCTLFLLHVYIHRSVHVTMSLAKSLRHLKTSVHIYISSSLMIEMKSFYPATRLEAGERCKWDTIVKF